VEPEIRSSPNRRRMALFALIGGSVTGLLTAFLVEWGHRGRGRRENQELVAAWRQFCTEVTGFVARRPRG
ncbi:MAG TPA: hypothetical protein VM557_04550, partial [Thermoanaerobaculia bacterium]|nr:hypothetical protein [Thermoanaerobaculia bacterium]